MIISIKNAFFSLFLNYEKGIDSHNPISSPQSADAWTIVHKF